MKAQAAAEAHLRPRKPTHVLDDLVGFVERRGKLSLSKDGVALTLTGSIPNRTFGVFVQVRSQRDHLFYISNYSTRDGTFVGVFEYTGFKGIRIKPRGETGCIQAASARELLAKALHLIVDVVKHAESAQAAAEPSTSTVSARAVLARLRPGTSISTPHGGKVVFEKDGDTDRVRATLTLQGRYKPKVFVLMAMDVRPGGVLPEYSLICVFAEYGRPDHGAGVGRRSTGEVVCSAGKSAASIIKEMLTIMLRRANKNLADSLNSTQAAAEADPNKPLTPNQCLVELQRKFSGKEVQKKFQDHTITITSLPSTYIKITVCTEQWKRDGFHFYDAYIGTSKSVRGTYPAVFDFSNGKKVVGDIHDKVRAPDDLLRNAVKLVIKSGDKEYKSWLRLKKRADKTNEAKAAAEPVSTWHMYAFTLYATQEEAAQVEKALKFSKLALVKAAQGQSKLYRMLVPRNNAVSELARAMLSNSGATLWLCKPERCGLAAGAIDLHFNSAIPSDVQVVAEIAPLFMKHLVLHDITASASSWFVVDVEEKNVEALETAFPGVPLEPAGSLDVRGSKLLSFKVAAAPGAVVAASAFAVSARTDTDQDPQLVFASEAWTKKLPEFIQAHSRFWCSELS